MLPLRPLLAPSSCLRCQLHHVILRVRTRTSSRYGSLKSRRVTRCFGSSAHRYEEDGGEENGPFLKSNRQDVRRRELYRRENPLGRVVGRHGRQQRETSQTLKIDSMQRPFDVVLMQDLPISKEPEEAHVKERSGARATDTTLVSRNLYDIDRAPTQEEVNSSIDELRPDTHSLDQGQYDALSERLLEGYNVKQLVSYLGRVSGSTTLKGSVTQRRQDGHASVLRSPWRPGRTPLEQSHESSNAIGRGVPGGRKRQIANRIIQDVWQVTVDTAEQEVGELEMSLQPWQLRYLFELRRGSRPNYEHIIQAPLLLRMSEFSTRREDNALRITARRQDASELADLIGKGLSRLDKLEIDLGVFEDLLGTAGWPSKFRELLPRPHLKDVEQNTMTVIERHDAKSLHIYGESGAERQHAKRVIMSLLHIPSPRSSTILKIDGERDASYSSAILVPEHTGSSLHHKHRNRQLFRLAAPTKRSNQRVTTAISDKLQEGRGATSLRILHGLNKLQATPAFDPPIRPSSSQYNGYWDLASASRSPPWQVQFCKILPPSVITRQQKAARGRTISAPKKPDVLPELCVIQSRVPGVSAFLSYFSTQEQGFAFDDGSQKPPALVANFMPSPSTNMGIQALRSLPRIQLRYNVTSLPNGAGTNKRASIHLSEMTATLSEQDVRVPLPDAATDLMFKRKVSLSAVRDLAVKSSEVQRFTRVLQQSISSETGALASVPSINIKLPRYLIDIAAANDNEGDLVEELEVEYLFERYEQIQTARFAPMQATDTPMNMDPSMKRVLANMLKSMLLQYNEVEGGFVGGSRSELTLIYDPTDQEQMTARTGDNGLGGKARGNLVSTALHVNEALTQINAGLLGPLSSTQ